jgi:hypothetical protein
MDIQISEANLFLATSKITDEETARQIVSSVKGMIAAEVKTANHALSTKEDLYKVKEELKEDLYKVKEGISQVEVRLSTKIYIGGLVQFLAIAGTVISVIAYMLQIK